jgi:hypothetical protein
MRNGIGDKKPNINKPPDVTTHKIHVTFFKDAFAKTLSVKEMTLPELRDLILSTKGESKGKLPWLKFAYFGKKTDPDKRTGCLRWDGNVTAISGIELDYDKSILSFDEIAATLKAMKVRALVNTSPGHTETAPRMRVLLPTSQKLTPDMRKKLCARVNGRFGNIFDPASFNLSQSYYYGLALDNPAPNHRAEIIDGRMIDMCVDDFTRFENDGYPKGADTNTNKTNTGDDTGPNSFEEYGEEHGGQQGGGFEAYLAKMGDGKDRDGNDLKGFNGPLISASSSYVSTHGAKFDREVLKVLFRTAINNAPKAPGRKNIPRYLSDGYLDPLIASAIKKFADEVKKNDILRLNQIHAVLPIGGKTRVVTFGEMEEFPGRETIIMTQTTGDFISLNNKYRHQWTDEKGKPQEIGMGTYWIMSRKRRQYDGGMSFMPRQDKKVVGKKLNLWNGYGVKPVKPDGKSGAAGCNLFLDFMRDVICSGNEEHFDYLRKREAFVLQKRIRCEVAVGLRSDEEGVGKGFYETKMGHLLGNHYMQINNPKHIVGAFNPHLETLLRLTADEALFVGNPEHRNRLFGLITDPTLQIEPKGCGVYDAENFLNISVLSNDPHFLPISGTARRFFLPTVSPIHMQDTVYFDAIQKQLDDGGYEALLYHFLHEVDLTDFNVRDVPKTEGLMKQRTHSLSPLDAWWCELLESGTLEGCDPCYPNKAVSNAYQKEVEVENENGVISKRFFKQNGLFDQAKSIEPRLRNHFTEHRLGGLLRQHGCVPSRPLRHHGWTFPALLVCRAKWEERFPNWPWRNTGLTKWQAEEENDNETNSPPEVGFEYTDASPKEEVRQANEDAAKAMERAKRLVKVAKITRERAKIHNQKKVTDEK